MFLGSPCSSVGKESACMQETQAQFLGQEDPLEKEMATLSSILAWKIPWTDEPGRFTVHGVTRVGHDLATKPPPPRFFREITTRREIKLETPNFKNLYFKLVTLFCNRKKMNFYVKIP